jgi:hypothetical protein
MTSANQADMSAGSGCRRKLGLRIAFRKPVAECVNDEQADDEKAYTYEDLEAAFLCLETNLPRGREQEHK